MAQQKSRGRPQKITDQQILDGALTLMADSHGELSIRKLAQRLGTAPSSIYNRYRTKNELLNTLADEKLKNILFVSEPTASGTWQVQLTDWMNQVRNQLHSQPGLSYLYAHQHGSAGSIQMVQSLVLLFEKAGLDREQAGQEAQGAIWHIFGFVSLELGAMRPAFQLASEEAHKALNFLGIPRSALDNFEALWHATLDRNILGIQAKIDRTPG